MSSPSASSDTLTIRRSSPEGAIVFVHGFQGDLRETWGQFAKVLEEVKALQSWDLFSVGYSSNLRIDLAGIWSADPPLNTVAQMVRGKLNHEPLSEYRAIVLVAHSMGGLVVQRALLDDSDLVKRTSHVLLYGTPSGGLVKAGLFQRFKRQFRDMTRGGEFITQLRQDWDDQFGEGTPFKFTAVAGENDEFVPYDASLGPFPEAVRQVVPGNHVAMVKPKDASSLSVRVLAEAIAGDSEVGGRFRSARVAIEANEFRRAIEDLMPHRRELDDAAAIQLAMALDQTGQRDEAMALLESRVGSSTDAKGTLAGRKKRLWLLERRQAHADEALQLYREGFEASKDSDPSQAFYHAINVAFMQFAYKSDFVEAGEWANRALEYATKAKERERRPDCWRLATEGEANLILDQIDQALAAYAAAIRATEEPWKWDSMYGQAIEVARQIGDAELEQSLTDTFKGATSSDSL